MKSFCAALAAALMVTAAGCSTVNPFSPSSVTKATAPATGAGQAVTPASYCGEGGCELGCSEGVCDSTYGCMNGDPSACGGRGCRDSCLGKGMQGVYDRTCKRDNQYDFMPGPPVGQVAYPYYTVRGPRDFLSCNPPSIGPR